MVERNDTVRVYSYFIYQGQGVNSNTERSIREIKIKFKFDLPLYHVQTFISENKLQDPVN